MILSKYRSLSIASLALVALLQGCKEEQKQAEEQKAEASGPPIAAVSPAVAKSSNIAVETVGPGLIDETMTFYGSVKPNGEREQGIRARYAGTVISVRKSAGDSVKKGETLVTIESSESLQTYAIVAPISGTVLDRKANPGEAVGSDATLMTIADLSTVWIDLAVFARDLGVIRAGLPVRITTADNRLSANTKLSFVAPAGDADNQSVVARAVLENTEGNRWVAGQFVTGEIALSSATSPLVVRSTALQTMNGKPTVFVQNPKGFEARTVQTGRSSSQSIEIRSGLRQGERYAATNSYLLKAELSKGEAEE